MVRGIYVDMEPLLLLESRDAVREQVVRDSIQRLCGAGCHYLILASQNSYPHWKQTYGYDAGAWLPIQNDPGLVSLEGDIGPAHRFGEWLDHGPAELPSLAFNAEVLGLFSGTEISLGDLQAASPEMVNARPRTVHECCQRHFEVVMTSGHDGEFLMFHSVEVATAFQAAKTVQLAIWDHLKTLGH